MRDYLSIGSAPAEEDCAQVGTPDYSERSREECARFIELIRKTCGEPPVGASLVTKTFPHDFGSYREVCVVFDDENKAATEYAYKVENDAPATWDAAD